MDIKVNQLPEDQKQNLLNIAKELNIPGNIADYKVVTLEKKINELKRNTMPDKKPLDKNSIENIVLNATEEEREIMRATFDFMAIDEAEKKALERNKKKPLILDFNNEIVEPLNRRAVYDVFNTKNGTPNQMSGDMVDALFGTNDADRINFGKKIGGAMRMVGDFRVRFKHYDIN